MQEKLIDPHKENKLAINPAIDNETNLFPTKLRDF